MFKPDTIVCGDCLDVMADMPDGCVDLVFADPPYNIGIFSQMKPLDYLAWCNEWLMESDRILTSRGAFWIIHKHPEVLIALSQTLDQTGRKRKNWITWDKFNDNPTYQAQGGPMIGLTQIKGLKSFQVMAEYLIYHASNQIGREIKRARQEAKLSTIQLAEHFRTSPERINHGGCITNWEKGYDIPTRRQLALLTQLLPLDVNYDDYAPVFNPLGGVSSVWQGPPPKRNSHKTPKPEWLLKRIIKATSNEGDIVADFFMGSGTTAVAALKLGRHFYGCDINPEYVKLANERIEKARLEMAQMEMDLTKF